MLKISAKFLLSLLALTILSALLWQQFITDTLYHCTDSLGVDYLLPGHWLHDPVSVPEIIPSTSMSQPDTIKTGWNQIGLLTLWFTFLSASAVVSILLARIPWHSAKPSAGKDRFHPVPNQGLHHRASVIF